MNSSSYVRFSRIQSDKSFSLVDLYVLILYLYERSDGVV